MLIASKCSIEKAQFTRFAGNSTALDEGFFDFVIKNGEETLGHICVINFKEAPYKETQARKCMRLIERMQEDILKMEEELIPFFLCGDFRALQFSEEGKALMDAYFQSENNYTGVIHALLLRSLPDFSHEVLSPEYSISTTSIALLGDYAGSLALFKKENAYSADDILKNISGNYWNGNYTILCGGRADVSAGKDSDGNASVEASVSFSDRSGSGVEYSAGASVEVKRDNDGNVSTEARANVGIGR